MGHLKRLGMLLLAVGCSALLGVIGTKAFTKEDSGPNRPLYKSSFHLGDQEEIVVVLLVSSTCGATEDPLFPAALDRVRKLLAAAGSGTGRHPVFAAVAVDWDPGVGLRTLEKFGSFDEINAGRQWLGAGLAHYGFIDPRFDMLVPQLIILSRTMIVTPYRVEVRGLRVLRRIEGIREIAAFSEGASLLDVIPGPS